MFVDHTLPSKRQLLDLYRIIGMNEVAAPIDLEGSSLLEVTNPTQASRTCHSRSGPPPRTERIRTLTTTYFTFLDYCTDSTYSAVIPQQNVTSQQLIIYSQHSFFRMVHCHRYSRISLRTELFQGSCCML